VQPDALEPAYLPAAQDVQAAAPPPEYRPLAQRAVGLPRPAEAQQEPAGHAVHDVEAAEAWYEPTAQSTHVVDVEAAVVVEYLPEGQEEHAAAPPVEYVPAPHLAHTVAW
jgi:hypothetical protein